MNVEKIPVVCVVHPNKNAYSETFIHAHIERLPAKNVLYGGRFPKYKDNDLELVPNSIVHKGINFVLRRFFSSNINYFQENALRNYFSKERIEAVLAEYGPTGVNVMNACKAEKVPLFVHFHGFDANDHETLKEYKKDYLQMFEIAAGIIVSSQHLRGKVLGLGAPVDKIHLNPYGVDVSQFSYADPILSPPVFLAVGRFVDKKAPHLTLLSFKMVLEKYKDARLLMIGEGELLEACKLQSNALKISSSVQFLGVLSSKEISNKMKTVRAFVQHSVCPSSGDSESLGNVFLEAGASGLPVVSTYHAGTPEVVLDGKTGFLVKEMDVEAMADRMLKLALDPNLASKFGKAARERICTEFPMEKSIGNLRRIINSAIHKD